MKKRNLDGFTMIEVMLTLAIGGLIISMVFLALPGALANARDSQRRDAVLLTVNRLKNFQANTNRGALPSGGPTGNGTTTVKRSDFDAFGATTGVKWQDFYMGFFDNNYKDPNGNAYVWKIVNCGTSAIGGACQNPTGLVDATFESNNYTMYFVIGATCDGSTAVLTANNRVVSVLYALERGGIYCANT